MENVRAVAMHVYALDVFGVDVSADVVAFFKHENAFALFQSKMRKHCAEQSASHYEIIVFFHSYLRLYCLAYLIVTIPRLAFVPYRLSYSFSFCAPQRR